MTYLRLRRKHWGNVQGVHRLNEHADVVAEHFAKSLIDLSRITLGLNRVAKLALYHREGRLYAASHMVVLHEGRKSEIVRKAANARWAKKRQQEEESS